MSTEYEVRPIPLYTEKDTWARVMADGMIKVGITDYAQKMLKEITFVDLPEIGSEVTQMQSFGSVESVKAVSDVICPISGTVKAVNSDVIDNPSMINKDPYDAGWLISIKPTDLEKELNNLLSADTYKALLKEKTSK